MFLQKSVLKCFLGLVLCFLTSYISPSFYHPLFPSRYFYSIIKQWIKCLPYHGDGHVHDAATILWRCRYNNFSVTIFGMSPSIWEICSWAMFFWPSRKSHICERGPKIFPIFNDKVCLVFFVCFHFFPIQVLWYRKFLQYSFLIYHYQVWNSSFVTKHISQRSHIYSMNQFFFFFFFVISNFGSISVLVVLDGFCWSLFTTLLLSPSFESWSWSDWILLSSPLWSWFW